MNQKQRHIFLVGPSGVGKTTVGREVASALNTEFRDLDEVISRTIGKTISDYFAEFGEAKFREVEREVLNDLAKETEPLVVATGGGTVIDTRNIVAMKQNGHVVYLSALEKDIIARVKADKENVRPLLSEDIDSKIHEQLENRRESYELAADITVATSRRDVETVTEAVVRQTSRLNGTNSDLSSSIIVGEDILPTLGQYLKNYRRIVLITQESIPKVYENTISTSLMESNIDVLRIAVPEGEEAKTFKTYINVVEQMLAALIPRSACVVALGGGVVGDLAGFVAATYHRGIDIVHIPTTLLAQVDSSIGGKCGINHEVGKNLVGAFHQPKLIFADVKVLDSLPENDFSSGLGEVVKYALLGNETVAVMLENQSDQILKRDPEVLVPLIKACMNHKLNVVSRDPLEKNGLRATLNLGHTLAHSIESHTKYELEHGKAVALGLRFCIQLSFELGRIPQSQKDEAIKLIDSLDLLNEMPKECRNAKSLVDKMYADKKSSGGLAFVLMSVGGGSELVHDVDESTVLKALSDFIENH
jgi:shikimate kinase/3-dehydroquinate synthase